MAAPTTIRDLLVRLGVVTNEKGVRSFDNALNAAKDTMEAASKLALGLTAAVGSLVGGMWLAASAGADTAERITQTAGAIGVTTDELQELEHVFLQFPVGAEKTQEVLQRTTYMLSEAATAGGAAADGFRLLGVDYKAVAKLDVPGQLEALAKGYADTGDATKRTVALTKLFGDGLARELAPALEGGADGIRRLRKEAHSAGLVIRDDLIARGNQAKGTMQLLREQFRSLTFAMQLAVVPAVEAVTGSMVEWLGANRDWINDNIESAMLGVERAAIAVTDAFDDLDNRAESIGGWSRIFRAVAVGIVAVGLPAAILAIGAAAAVVSPIVGAMSLPLLGLAAAVGLAVVAGEDLYTWLQGGDSVFGRFLSSLGDSGELLSEVHGLFASLTSAAQRAGAALVDVSGGAIGPLGDAVGGLVGILRDGLGVTLRFVTRSIRTLRQSIDLLSGIDQADSPLIQLITLGKVILGIWSNISDTFDDLGGFLGSSFGTTESASADILGPRATRARTGIAKAAGAVGSIVAPPVALAASYGYTPSEAASQSFSVVVNATTGASPEEIARAIERKLGDVASSLQSSQGLVR